MKKSEVDHYNTKIQVTAVRAIWIATARIIVADWVKVLQQEEFTSREVCEWQSKSMLLKAISYALPRTDIWTDAEVEQFGDAILDLMGRAGAWK